jgi:preprotein translocase subunit SecE
VRTWRPRHETGAGPGLLSGTGSGAAAKRDRTTPALFTRQVAAELRKVIWPTRRELGTYTAVALSFVIFMTVIVTSLDYGFTKLMFWFFG